MYHPTDVCADQSLSFQSSLIYCSISMKYTLEVFMHSFADGHNMNAYFI